MNTRQMLVNASKYNIKCPYSMNAEFIIVHNTANDASANNEISYMINNDIQVSFHFAVDHNEAVQGIPLDRNTWNAGDGANGNGNRKGISIEICYSLSGGDRFIQAEKNAAKLIAQLLKERNWGIDKVKKHQDFSNKYCPHRTLDMGWSRFLNMVQNELNVLNNNTTSNKSTLYKVQVGAFKNRVNVEKLSEELINKGIGTFVTKVNDLYKVQCGAYSNADNARNMAQKLNNMGYSTYIKNLNESTSAKQQGIAYRVNCEYPNIRSSASLNASIVRRPKKNDIIYVVGQENGFLKLVDGTYLKVGFADKI